MAHTSSSRKLSYALSYGFLGGQLHARKLNKLMREAGYKGVPDPHQADIIIAHSAGCWLVPKDCKPSLIIYVGMPLKQTRPSRALIEANKIAFRHGSLRSTILTKAKVTFYGIFQPRRNWQIIRLSKTATLPIFSEVETVFIANRHDPWPIADKLEGFVKEHDWAFLSLAGTHDDIWEKPKRYVEIINHYAGLLD